MKNGEPSKKKKNNSQKQNKPKGELLEQVVAALYRTPGVKIETNVDYPTKDGKSTREIDILLTATVAGLVVEYAFQCKNEIKPIGVGKVTQFYGDLIDIGIPPQYGIFVTVNGFTKDAQRFATNHGIKTRVFKGLAKDRLKSEISSAIQHNIYLLPRVEQLSVINKVARGEHEYQFVMFSDEHNKPTGTVLDLIFNKWRNGEISEVVGNHTVQMEVPVNWFQFYKGESVPPMKVSAKITVLAVVIKIDGIAENHILLDPETQKIERFRTKIKFQGYKEGDEVPLTVIFGEQELKEFIERSEAPGLTVKSRLPRIISNKFYYPFSKPVADKIFNEITKYSLVSNGISQEKFDEILSEVTKNDLFREGIYNFWGKEVSVIVTDNEGDLIDLSLFAQKGNFDKVISLSDRYRVAPSDTFRKMLAWANESKSKKISHKAEQAKLNQTDLFKKSLEHINASLEFDSESISALEQKTELLFITENYNEALNYINLVLREKREDVRTHVFRAQILIKLKDWDSALKEIKSIEKLAKTAVVNHDSLKFNIKLYLAEILQGQGKHKESWAHILEAWRSNPEAVIKYLSRINFVNEILQEVLTIESRLFHIELLFFRANEFLNLYEHETARDVADFAITLLNDIKTENHFKEEPIAAARIDDTFVEAILERIVKLLTNQSNKFFKEQINKIGEWFKQMYKKELSFLKD